MYYLSSSIVIICVGHLLRGGVCCIHTVRDTCLNVNIMDGTAVPEVVLAPPKTATFRFKSSIFPRELARDGVIR